MQHSPCGSTTTPAATPTFSPGAGTYGATQTVTIKSTTSSAIIHYTTNRTTPTVSPTLYSGPIAVSASEAVEAIATVTDHTSSAVGSAAYTIRGGGFPLIDLFNASGALPSQWMNVTVDSGLCSRLVALMHASGRLCLARLGTGAFVTIPSSRTYGAIGAHLRLGRGIAATRNHPCSSTSQPHRSRRSRRWTSSTSLHPVKPGEGRRHRDPWDHSRLKRNDSVQFANDGRDGVNRAAADASAAQHDACRGAGVSTRSAPKSVRMRCLCYRLRRSDVTDWVSADWKKLCTVISE